MYRAFALVTQFTGVHVAFGVLLAESTLLLLREGLVVHHQAGRAGLCNLNDPTECAAGDVCVPYEDIGPYLLTPELGYVGLCVPA